MSVAHGAAAVRLDQLAAGSVRRYLDRYGTAAWRKVLAELGTETPVGKALRTPLMVSLAHAVYSRHETDEGAQPAELLAFASEQEIRDYLSTPSFPPPTGTGRPVPSPRSGHCRSWPSIWSAISGYAIQRKATRPGTRAEDFEWWRLRDSVPFPVIGLVVGLLPAFAVGLVAAKRPGLGVALVSVCSPVWPSARWPA